jgi:hypothetical protein
MVLYSRKVIADPVFSLAFDGYSIEAKAGGGTVRCACFQAEKFEQTDIDRTRDVLIRR